MAMNDKSKPDLEKRVAGIEDMIKDVKRWGVVLGTVLGVTGVGTIIQLHSRVSDWADQQALQGINDQIEKNRGELNTLNTRVEGLKQNVDESEQRQQALLAKAALIQKDPKPITASVARGDTFTSDRMFPFDVKNAWTHCTKSSGTDFNVDLVTEGKKVTVNIKNTSSTPFVTLEMDLEVFATNY